MQLNMIKFNDETLEGTMEQINKYLEMFPYKIVIQIDDKGEHKFGGYTIIIWYYNNNV